MNRLQYFEQKAKGKALNRDVVHLSREYVITDADLKEDMESKIVYHRQGTNQRRIISVMEFEEKDDPYSSRLLRDVTCLQGFKNGSGGGEPVAEDSREEQHSARALRRRPVVIVPLTDGNKMVEPNEPQSSIFHPIKKDAKDS
mmetsp:Transcript_3803/g.4376  ORF Transcript_3803/g.4376 Transcript_3803/m.4376 type:complete len:143 (+) Transcript_3803:1376-1804(+)